MKVSLYIIGISQLVLGVLFLLVPQVFLEMMGLPRTDISINFIFGMLAARFIVFGIGMFYVSRNTRKRKFWINMMILTQLIDLTVGIIYTSSGDISLRTSAFPMFNATLFTALLIFFYPRQNRV